MPVCSPEQSFRVRLQKKYERYSKAHSASSTVLPFSVKVTSLVWKVKKPSLDLATCPTKQVRFVLRVIFCVQSRSASETLLCYSERTKRI